MDMGDLRRIRALQGLFELADDTLSDGKPDVGRNKRSFEFINQGRVYGAS
jgi:hypothetical protein